MAITETRYATKETDVRETNIGVDNINKHENLGGFFPEAGTLTPSYGIGEKTDYKIDSAGNLSTRGAVTTDEGSVREDFLGNTLHHVDTGTVTFTNGSTIVTTTGIFTDGDLQFKDFIRLDTDTDTDYKVIKSILTDTSLELEEPYGGTGGSGTLFHTKFIPYYTDGTITVANSICTLSSGTTDDSNTSIFRNIDYCPLVYAANLSISQRIANQMLLTGLVDLQNTSGAYFQFVGTDNLSVNCVSFFGTDNSDYETTTITLLTNTSVKRKYRVEVQQEYVNFYIDSVLKATHTNHIPTPYAFMRGGAGLINQTSVASNTDVEFDNIFLGNIDALQITNGLAAMPVTIMNRPLLPAYVCNSAFSIELEIIRPTNTTDYSKTDLINNDGATTLPYFDFSVLGDLQNRYVEVDTIIVLSDNGSAAVELKPLIHLFNSDTIVGSTLTDNTKFDPSYSEMKLKRILSVEPLFSTIDTGVGCYLLTSSERSRSLRLNVTSKCYLALIDVDAYVPASGEKITVILKGILS